MTFSTPLMPIADAMAELFDSGGNADVDGW